MNKEEHIQVITDKEKLYDKCENMEQLYDKYYLPLLDKHYSKIYKLQQENKQLKEQVMIMKKYLELITDLAFDYDGCNTIDGLKDLIDELVKYASLGRVCNLTEPIYENNGVKYNILHQELEESE